VRPALKRTRRTFPITARRRGRRAEAIGCRTSFTTISWHDSAGARTRLVVPARKSGKHRRWVSRGFLVHEDKVGANRLHFSGRLNGSALRPGKYRLKVVGVIGGQHGNPVTTASAVARSRR
jgi:hypothetical protein